MRHFRRGKGLRERRQWAGPALTVALRILEHAHPDAVERYGAPISRRVARMMSTVCNFDWEASFHNTLPLGYSVVHSDRCARSPREAGFAHHSIGCRMERL